MDPGGENRKVVGLWWFPGALRRQEISLVLSAAVDWGEGKGRTTQAVVGPWSTSPCTCSYAYGTRPRYRATDWRAVLATAQQGV